VSGCAGGVEAAFLGRRRDRAARPAVAFDTRALAVGAAAVGAAIAVLWILAATRRRRGRRGALAVGGAARRLERVQHLRSSGALSRRQR
jgi:hypothetical protein